MLKSNRIKIWAIIIGFFSIIWKAIKYGKNKILFKQLKQRIKNKKKCNEINDVIDNATDDELSKLL